MGELVFNGERMCMKIIQLNCVYPNGSTGKIVQILHKDFIEQGNSSIVLYGRGEKIDEDSIYKVCSEINAKFNHLLSCFNGIMYGGCWLSTQRIMSIIKSEQPDVVHLHCINGYWVNIYRLITWLRDSGIPTVITLHAEFMYTANCGYALECENWRNGCGNCPRLKKETHSLFFDRTSTSFDKMRKAFIGFEEKLAVVSVSPWLLKRAKQSLILEDKKHVCIYNGVNTDVFKYTDKRTCLSKYCNTDEKVILHVTAMFTDQEDSIKGGLWLIQLAELLKDRHIRFIVVGKHNVKQQVPSNITLVGEIKFQELLAKFYAESDLTLLVSKKETFSMVVAESLCCGTPVVGFKAGAPEQIALAEYSDFYEQEDLVSLISGIDKWLNTDVNKSEIAKKASLVYSMKAMTANYLSIYGSLK